MVRLLFVIVLLLGPKKCCFRSSSASRWEMVSLSTAENDTGMLVGPGQMGVIPEGFNANYLVELRDQT